MWVERDGVTINLRVTGSFKKYCTRITYHGKQEPKYENPRIIFSSGDTWFFDDAEERDEIYDWLLNIIEPRRVKDEH